MVITDKFNHKILLKPDNFIYFIRELEFRYNLKNNTYNEKLNEIKILIEYSMDTCNYNFYVKNFIVDIIKNNYIDESDEDSDD